MPALYATFEQAQERVELGVTGVQSYGREDRDSMERQRLIYELCEWHDAEGNEFRCWVLHYLDEALWDYVNRADATECGLS